MGIHSVSNFILENVCRIHKFPQLVSPAPVIAVNRQPTVKRKHFFFGRVSILQSFTAKPKSRTCPPLARRVNVGPRADQ